jgi:hypothetical protein
MAPWFKMPVRDEAKQRALCQDLGHALSGARCALILLADEPVLRTVERELVNTSLAQIARVAEALNRVLQ